jgi:pyridoxal phosphate enzyme (YggS family)
MGVSKFHERKAVDEAYSAGIRLFGESRVQEAAEKFQGFRDALPDAEVHLIGSLQRNKARAALALFDCVQSVDRDSLINELGKIPPLQTRRPVHILLELHTAEDSKSGFPNIDSLCFAAEKVLAMPGFALAGLMTMAPNTGDEGAIRSSFRSLVSAQSFLEARFPGHWGVLSMGMSGDFEIAIEEGSTLVRIGTAIFGERK